MLATRYPRAEWRGDAYVYGNAAEIIAHTRGAGAKIAMHTTETQGVPGYNSGRSSPTATYWVAKRRWIQHAPIGAKVGTLRRPSQSFETNGLCIAQFEITCYSSKSTANGHPDRIWAGHLDDDHLADIAGFLKFVVDEWNVPLNYVAPPHNDSRCYGTGSPCRWLVDQWISFWGVVQHAQVPLNTHWDCDGLRLDRIIELASSSGGGGPVTAPLTKEQATRLANAGIIKGSGAAAYWSQTGAHAGETRTADEIKNNLVPALAVGAIALIDQPPCPPDVVADAAHARGMRNALHGLLGT